MRNGHSATRSRQSPRRRGAGRPYKLNSRELIIPLEPHDGIKAALVRISEERSVPPHYVARLVLYHLRDRYAQILDEFGAIAKL